jgi:hypothetical protein
MTNPATPAITVDDMVAQVAYEDAAARAASYGVRETGTLTAETVAMRKAIDYSKPATWLGDRNLVKIHVVRLLGFGDYDCPFVELSYCYGLLADGTPVRVDLGRSRFNKRTWKSELIQCFKDAKRFGKAMGMDFNDPYKVSRI